ncbi:MAG: hypothetical protein K0Q87_5422 [Neobacillus sp.]|nr:hypothetical protein [Neobacillus sp.]
MSFERTYGYMCPEGIKVEEHIYSCPKAIREQWFEKVREVSPVKVDVFRDPSSIDEICLLLSVGYVSV